MNRTFQQAVCIGTAIALTGCSTTHQHAELPVASTRASITLPPCAVSPLQGARPIGKSTHWSGNCGIDGAMGDGIAVWGAQDHFLARYTGSVTAGIPTGPGAHFYDGKTRFEGIAKDGKAFLGKWTDGNGTFEGRFDGRGDFDQGILRKPDGTAIAGRFSGRSPIGTFVVKDSNDKLWYGEMRNGEVVKRAAITRSDMSALGALGLVALAAGFAMVFLVTGALVLGTVAAMAAAGPAAGVIIVLL